MLLLKHLGWIIDIYPKADSMIIWLKKTDGTCVKLTDQWKPRFHIAGEPSDLSNLTYQPFMSPCKFVEKFEKAGDQFRRKVLEVAVVSEREALESARRIQRYGNFSRFRLYNVDIPSTQMYLYQKGLFPFGLVEAEETGNGVRWTLRDSRESTDYELPPLRRIEFRVTTNLFGRIRSFEDGLHSVTIRDGNEILRIDSGDETEKLLKLVKVFREINPDIILTEDGDSFIFPYLARRADLNRILNSLILGREEVPLRIYELQGHSYFSYGKILFRQTVARLFGRLHIDASSAFIGTDCGLEGLFEVARTCIIPVQRASRTTIGTSMTSLQLYHAVKQDVLIPWNKNEAEDWKNGKELLIADRGGLIYEPQFGIHDSVGELDFSSLYPTIMMKKNLSGETVKCECCPNSTSRVPELSWNICERWEGIVPRSLRILLRKRMLYKKLKKETIDPHIRLRYDQRQAALKWILVCSFGYLGFKNARFGKIDAHIATCAYSREILRKAVAFAESKGFKLVHGIVDSMWLKKADATNREYEDLACEIARELDLPISFEGQYKWIVFLNSQMDRHVPVLNRYYGVSEDGKLKLRGIELRRHDTPRIVNECQNQMLRVFSRARNSEEFRKLIPEAFAVVKLYATKLRQRDAAIEDLIISKNLSKNPEDYEKIIPQAVAARHLVREGHEVQAGQSVCYVLTRRKSRMLNNRALPLELANTGDYDIEKYVDLLRSSAMNLLLPLGYDLKLLREG